MSGTHDVDVDRYLLVVWGLSDGNVHAVYAPNTLVKVMSLLEPYGSLVKPITLLKRCGCIYII